MDNIRIVGAPQFDFYYQPDILLDEVEWRSRFGISKDQPIILFAGGLNYVAPIEPHWLYQLDEAIEKKLIKNDPIIMLREHPADSITRWQNVLNQCHHVILNHPHISADDKPYSKNSRWELMNLASTLKYCDIHINTSSTMTVDGAIFDKPQIGPAYDDQPGIKLDRAMRDLYQREHYLPITNSGGLEICYSYKDLISSINQAFDFPYKRALGRKKMIHEICTYDDGLCTRRVFDAVEYFINN
jgi:CDP-glycerol glycerophosphotransferase (TagB/SpsB family)